MIDRKKLTKRYYSISEVGDLFDVAPSVLRYWESEFKAIRPTKGRNGIRRYTADDIETINEIHQLLKERGFTIDGAKKELKKPSSPTDQSAVKAKLLAIRQRLIDLRDQLDHL